jgi:hypothetical protein
VREQKHEGPLLFISFTNAQTTLNFFFLEDLDCKNNKKKFFCCWRNLIIVSLTKKKKKKKIAKEEGERWQSRRIKKKFACP